MVEQLLGGLFGGDQDQDDDQRRRRGRDFVDRYERGAPHEGYTDDEAVHNFRQVAGRLSPQQFEDAAADTFSRMSPDERRQLKRELRQRQRARGGGRPDDRDDDNDDPREMARMAGQMQQENQGSGGLLGMLGLGGGGDQPRQNAPQQQQEGGGLLDNPLTKVALAGIAAMAVKKMTEGHDDQNPNRR